MDIKRFFKLLGPGLLYAGAAIGVSHLVQSTRAGALFAFQLMGIVILTNILKYPFFETGSRYSAATGNSLIHAFKKQGNWILWFYVIQCFVTMFIIQSALTIVAAGLSKTLFQSSLPIWAWLLFISIACILILFIGQMNLLKNMTKWLVIGLTICTVIAAILAAQNPVQEVANQTQFSMNNAGDVVFLVALIGWMPAPIDISVWQSVWRVDGKESRNVKDALLDFHVGYWATVVVSISFMSLGAYMMFNSGEELQSSASGFASQLVAMYTKAIGSWSWLIVAFAAFATMFSTCLTCLDANPRVMLRSLQELKFKVDNRLYVLLVIICGIGAVVIPLISGGSMTDLVDFATTVSFLTAPLFATINFQINFGSQMPKHYQPGNINKIISWLGLIFLYGFAVYYLWIKFF